MSAEATPSVQIVATTQPMAGISIVEVCTSYAPVVGGVERCVEEFAHGFSARGARVEVHTTDRGAKNSPRREVVDGVVVHRHRSVTLAGLTLSLGLFLAILRTRRDARVHVHVPHAGLVETVAMARWLRRAPFVAQIHLDVPPSTAAGRLLPVYRRSLLAPCLRAARSVLVLTEQMRAALVREQGLHPDRVTVVPNGVDERFERPSRVPRRGIGSLETPAHVLFVGRLVTQKNPDLFVVAVDRLTCEFVATVVGEGPLRPALADRVELAGRSRQIHLAGAEDAEGVLRWLDWADVLVSTSDVEGMPLVCLEAFAAGVPVVATDVPGTREVVDGVGVLVPADAGEIRRAVERLVRDVELRATLMAAGRKRAAQLTWSRACDEVGEVLMAGEPT